MRGHIIAMLDSACFSEDHMTLFMILNSMTYRVCACHFGHQKVMNMAQLDISL